MASNAWSPSKVPDVSDPTVFPGGAGAFIAPGGIVSAEAFGSAVVSVNSFTGDFGALFNGYSGLNVRAFFRGDLGVTGTTGTGKSAWANQLGDAGNMGPATSTTNGIGSVGTGLNGHASVLTDGTTQGGLYTFPSQPAPATTNCHIYAIERIVANPGVAQGYMHSAANNCQIHCFAGQTSPAANVLISSGSAGAQTTGVVEGQWYRVRGSRIGGNDVIRVGAHEPTPVTTSNAAAGTSWGWACAYNGTSLIRLETLAFLHVEGPLATFLTACTDADAKARAYYTTAIEI